MVKTTNKKQGFSLVEALVSMLILSVFFLASYKVLSVRQKEEIKETPHGYYECYRNGSLFEHRADGTSATASKLVAECKFDPPKGVHLINMFVVTNGSYVNTTQTQFNIPVTVDIEGFRQQIEDSGEAEEQEGNIDAFLAYLRITNPKSEMLRLNAPDGVYIAW